MGKKALQKFVALHGTTNCGKLRERFVEEEQMNLCREPVKQGTRNLLSLINDRNSGDNEKASTPEKCGSCA